MKITNKTNLPQAFVEMAKRDYIFEPGEYRVTSLLKGIREIILERRHDAEIERDASDMIWLLFGTAAHSILENQKEEDNEIKETRIKIPFTGYFGSYVLSGQFDLYNADTKTITDYKTASVWKVIFGDYTDWRRQLLIYAYMMRQIGFPVEHGEIVAILKDHSKREAKIKSNYPEMPVKLISFDFTDKDFTEIEEWLANRFWLIKEAEATADDDLPLCTPEERFNSGDKYAVKKKGNKKAARVFDHLQDAEAFVLSDSNFEIEVRPGEDKKCIDYCSCNQFCNYYRDNVACKHEEVE